MELKNTTALIEFATSLNRAVSDLLGDKHVDELCSQQFPNKDLIISLIGEVKISKEGNAEKALRAFFLMITCELEKSFGLDFTEAKINSLYRKFQEKNDEEVSKELIMLLPENFLEEERIKYLNKTELENYILLKNKEIKNLKKDIEEKIKSRTEKLEALIREKESSEKILMKSEQELIETNANLTKIDKIKSEFVSITAHQLRTPLSGIKWTLALIINGDFGELAPEQKTFLVKTYESTNRLITLVGDLLSIDHLHSGKSDYIFRPALISEIMENLIFEMEPLAEKKKIKITFENKALDLPKIKVDAEKMRAVFQNLIENAIKYTNHNGTILIEFIQKGSSLEIKVRDSGIGIPESQQRNIFRQFFRATNAREIETDGSGLGLFIAKTIIERHSGTLSFESTENIGTTFIINLPLVKNHE